VLPLVTKLAPTSHHATYFSKISASPIRCTLSCYNYNYSTVNYFVKIVCPYYLVRYSTLLLLLLYIRVGVPQGSVLGPLYLFSAVSRLSTTPRFSHISDSSVDRYVRDIGHHADNNQLFISFITSKVSTNISHLQATVLYLSGCLPIFISPKRSFSSLRSSCSTFQNIDLTRSASSAR